MYEFKRYEKNPVLTVGDLPEKAGYYLLNPGAVQFRGEFLLMADVFHTEGGIVFWMARSQDGVHFAFDPKPVAMPECSDGWEENGVYDPRITEMDGVYYIVYNSHNNRRGTRLAIMKTTDFRNYEHVSFVSGVNNRNGALFPEKINGLYCCFNRPFAGDEKTPCSMEMSFSPDLVFWGRNRESLAPRAAHWDGMKLGIGAPPLRIDEGWLIIYHGVVDSCCGSIYSMSAAILDYREPWKVLARTNKPVLFPEAPYEKQGRITNTVFSCNALRIGDNIRMYYGAADAVICMAEMPLAEMVRACHEPYCYMMHY